MKKKYIVIGLFVSISFIRADFALAATKYWVGGNASPNWNAGTTGVDTNWGTASGVRDFAAVPTSADDVIFDNSANGNSASTVSASITIKSFDASAYTNTFTHNSVTTITINNGNITMGSGMTYKRGSTVNSQWTINATCALTSAGKTFSRMEIKDGTTTLQDDLTMSFSMKVGSTSGSVNPTLDTNDKNLSMGSLNVGGVATLATFLMRSGSHTIKNGGNILNFSDTSNTTITPGTSTLTFDTTTGGLKQFDTQGHSLNNLVFFGAAGGGSTLQIDTPIVVLGNVLFNKTSGIVKLVVQSDSIPYFTVSGTITQTGSFDTQFRSSNAGSTARISKASGNVSLAVDLQDITAQGGATWNAICGSVNGGNNRGWNFSSFNKSKCLGHLIRGGVKFRAGLKFR